MILDTSAVMAVVLDEPGAERVLDAIVSAPAVKMSAATLVELRAVIHRRLQPQDVRRVERLLSVWQVQVVPLDEEQADEASRAYRDFGRGSGHPAGLDLGDCFTYGLAAVAGEPLAYVGQDFVHTDVVAAVPSA